MRACYGYDLRELIKLNIYLYFIHECDRTAFQQHNNRQQCEMLYSINRTNHQTELRLNEKFESGSTFR